MLTATMHGPIVSLDALAGGGTSEGSNTSATRARSSIHESVRCGAAGNVDKALDRGLEAYREEGAPVELRLEAAKLCIDWYAALGSYGQCRKLAGEAARLGERYLERCHPLILMMRNSEAYWLAILGQHDMAIRKFSALLADMKHCPGLDPDISIAIRNNSAMPWKYTGKWKKAARVYRELLSELEEQREESDMTLLTVRDNLAPGTHAVSDDRMRTVLRQVGLCGPDGRLDLDLDTDLGQGGISLSGGQRQRLAWARLLLGDADILLLDEPTTFLDVSHQVEVLDLLTDLNASRGTTIVMVLHDLNLAARYADVLVAMQGGRIRAVGAPGEVVTPKLVREVFGLESLVAPDPVSGEPMVMPIGRHHVLAR